MDTKTPAWRNLAGRTWIGELWKPGPPHLRYPLRRSEAFLQEDAPYGSERLLLEPAVDLGTNCYTSHAISGVGVAVWPWTPDSDKLHLPVLDIDDEHGYDALPFLQEVFQTPNVFFHRSTTNWHAYIGAVPGGEFGQGIPWDVYRTILRYLETVELVDPKWVDHSCAEGYCTVRKPGYPKFTRSTQAPETCMWCGKPFPETLVDAHEEECGR
ncbi:MAG: hypothetical protein EBR40_10960 [Proteobacteria bacterium]|nr:hypothetical protein [Pseudomonadota bacterium]